MEYTETALAQQQALQVNALTALRDPTRTGRRIAGAVAAVTFAVTGCASGTETTLDRSAGDTTTTVVLNTEQQQAIDQLCPAGFGVDMPISREFDLSRVGSTDALLPSFETVKNGEKTLATPYEVSGVVMERACVEPTLLAVMDALFLQTAGYGEKGRYAKPDSTLLSVIEERAKLFRSNEQAATNTLENLATVILPEGGVVYVNNFNVVSGQATLITTERDENGNALQIKTTKATVEGLFEGYQLRFNLDATNLTPVQKATLKAISELVLFRPDGTILINDWLGEGTTGFKVDDTSSESSLPVNTVQDSLNSGVNSSSTSTSAKTNNGSGSSSGGSASTSTPANGTTPSSGSTPANGTIAGGNGSGSGSGGNGGGSGGAGGIGSTATSAADAPGTPGSEGTPTDVPGTIAGGPNTTAGPDTTIGGPNTTAGPGTTIGGPNTTAGPDTTIGGPTNTTIPVTNPNTTTSQQPNPTTTAQAADVCPNIPGVQKDVPLGQELVLVNGEWICKDIPPVTTTGNPAP